MHKDILGQYTVRIRLMLVILSLNLALILPVLLTFSVHAYKSTTPSSIPKLPGAATTLWVFYNHLDSALGIQDSGMYVLDALNQWNLSSWYTVFDLFDGGPNNQSANNIKAVNFSNYQTVSCGNLNSIPGVVYGATCVSDRNIFLNLNFQFKWNTTGTFGSFNDPICLCLRYHSDFSTVLLHELGHFWTAAHPTSSTVPVMYFNATSKQTLTEDDKQAVTQFYGPDTGWETNLTLSWFPNHSYVETMGIGSTVLYQSQVSSAQLIPRSPEFSVTPFSGTRYLKLYGNAQASAAYAYMKLFSADNDEVGSNSRHLTIANGMKLQWRQYSHAQRTISVDIIFSDGTTLRDTMLTDQYGVRVHPAHRGGYSTGVWRFFEVNLSSLAGKRVQHVVIAYDNGNNGQVGIFRAYFDNLNISY